MTFKNQKFSKVTGLVRTRTDYFQLERNVEKEIFYFSSTESFVRSLIQSLITCFCGMYSHDIMRKSENLTKFFKIISNEIMKYSDIFRRISDFLMISWEHITKADNWPKNWMEIHKAPYKLLSITKIQCSLLKTSLFRSFWLCVVYYVGEVNFTTFWESK